MNKYNYINGPLNAVRIEGEVYGIKKVLYIFMDYHNYITKQTKCPSFVSIDFVNYLASEFQNLDNELDFFMEIGITNLNYYKSQYKDRYIDEVAKFFSQTLKIQNNKNIGTSLGENIRFHWIDIRDVIKNNINKNLDNIYKYLDEPRKYITKIYSALSSSYTYFLNIKKDMIFLSSHFDKTYAQSGGKINLDIEDYIENITYFFNKLNNSYNHNESYKQISILYKNIYKHYYKIIDILNNIISQINNYKDKNKEFITDIQTAKKLSNSNKVIYGTDYFEDYDIINNIYKQTVKMENHITILFSSIVDMYFLRRFIDKDYVKNAVVYTGLYHSIEYIRILCTRFNMKITHVSYSSHDIDTINNLFTDKDLSHKKLSEILVPPNLIQCSDITTFPSKFK